MTGNRAREIDYNQNILTYRSRINRALGNTRPVVEEGLKIKESEQGVLSEILSMWQRSSSLHKSVFMHSLMYDDCSLVAMTGEFKRDKHVASNYIHPIIACMFLPKFDIFEFHMLYSNFGSIIKAKHEKKPIITEPDALLYNDMITDPNDVVCDISSPITDIRNRYKVQISLWETVLKLRSGNYYEANPISDFLQVLNECRNNLYDNADLAYNQDEGAIMRKILSIFSLRPTFIATKPIYTIASFVASPFSASVNMGMGGINQGFGNNFGQSGFPFNSQPTYTVTRIPMLTLQLPPFVGTGREEPINLRSAINQTIGLMKTKQLFPKNNQSFKVTKSLFSMLTDEFKESKQRPLAIL